MYPHIEIAAGTVQGHQHRLKGQNNQDAFEWAYVESLRAEDDILCDPVGYQCLDHSGVIAVVCDGCGSCPSSEVGAQLGAKWVVNAIAERLQGERYLSFSTVANHQFWRKVQHDVLAKMRSFVASFQPSSTDGAAIDAGWSIIHSYLLFTVIGAVITPDTTVIFGFGDGVFALNDDVQSIGPFVNNAPPYLAYGLMPEGHTSFNSEDLHFTIHRHVPTSEVRSLLIGSDGVEDLRAIASQTLPNKTEPIGAIHQFWQGDRYFKNPDMVRRRLALINREHTKPDWSNQQLTKIGGLLPDDTTLVVMRRSEPTPSPS